MANATDYLNSLNALTGDKPLRHILVDTFNLLSDETKWAQHAHAKNAQGEKVRPEDPTACSWCLLGAAAVVCNPHGITPPSVIRYLDEYIVGFSNGLFDRADAFSDITDHKNLLSFLDYSIARSVQ